jgi:hypothetical protein
MKADRTAPVLVKGIGVGSLLSTLRMLPVWMLGA